MVQLRRRSVRLNQSPFSSGFSISFTELPEFFLVLIEASYKQKLIIEECPFFSDKIGISGFFSISISNPSLNCKISLIVAYSFSSEKELILFSDESISKGKFYSNFYGGVLVGASQYQRIQRKLDAVREKADIHSEIKWSKVTPAWLDGYKLIIDAFFEEIVSQKLKVRIMFRQNAHTPINLSEDQKEQEYYLLFYQFIKNAFGLDHLNSKEDSINLRFFFDQFPDKKEKSKLFKQHIMKLQDGKFKRTGLQIKKENINEARSHDHIILQCTLGF